MGANVPVWVEIYVKERRWVKTYGITAEDAMFRVEEETGADATGRTSYTEPQEPTNERP